MPSHGYSWRYSQEVRSANGEEFDVAEEAGSAVASGVEGCDLVAANVDEQIHKQAKANLGQKNR